MAEKDRQQAPTATAATPPQELARLKELWREYGQSVLLGVGLAVAFLVGFAVYRTYRQNSILKAAQALARAGSVEQLQQVVSQYPSTPSAPLAMLTMAARQFDQGQYEMAQYTYAQFLERYPDHLMKEAAELGRAQCLEAMGDGSRALEAFEAFIASRPLHFLVPLARLGRGRVLVQEGRLEEARTAYEEFLVQHPDSGWAPVAENALDYVKRRIRAATAFAPIAPALAMPETASPEAPTLSIP